MRNEDPATKDVIDVACDRILEALKGHFFDHYGNLRNSHLEDAFRAAVRTAMTPLVEEVNRLTGELEHAKADLSVANAVCSANGIDLGAHL